MTAANFDLRAADLDAGTQLLEASAGTGKTYTLTGIVLRSLLEGTIDDISQALVVTFTIAAAEELKTRLRDGLQRTLRACSQPIGEPLFDALGQLHGQGGARRLRQALADFDRLSVSTIHSFCKRLLEEAAFESGALFHTEFVEDEIPLLHGAAQDALRRVAFAGDAFLAAVVLRAKLGPDELVRVYHKWQLHADVALEPAAAPLEPVIAELRAALAAAAAAFDEQAAARITALRFAANKSPFDEDQPQVPNMLRQLFATTPAAALGPCLDLAPTTVAANLLKGCSLEHPFFAACEALRSAYVIAQAQARVTLLQAMHAVLGRRKAIENTSTFHDLLARTADALADPRRRKLLVEAVQRRWRVALIDEFQDTDPLQYEIFATCFRDRPMFLIGDPKQSIYGFRGADVHAYLAARKDAAAEWTLATNYRSNAQLVAAVQQLFGRARAFVTPGIELPQVRPHAGADQLTLAGDGGASLCWRYVAPRPEGNRTKALWSRPEATERIVADVAGEIVRLLGGRLRCGAQALHSRNLAILTRTNAQAVAMQDALRASGVHSAIGQAGDIFETDEMAELERFLRPLLQPRNLALVRAAFATRLWGLDAAAIAGLADDDATLEVELLRLDRWRRLWLRQGIVVMIEQAFAELALRTRMLRRADGERRLTNYLQVVELLHHAECEQHLSPEALLRWLQHEREHADEIDYRRRELRLESDADAVQILTVHGSKGLQYDVVFCPFLWSTMPERKQNVLVRAADGSRTLVPTITADDPRWLVAEQERLAEDLRLAYVGVTRARRRCYVYFGGLNGAQHSSLAWLLLGATDLSDANWPTRWTSQLLDSVRGWRDVLQRFVGASGGTMSLTDVPEQPLPGRIADAAAPRLQSVRAMPARLPRPWQMHSFTSLTAFASEAAGETDFTAAIPDHFDPPAGAAAGIAEGIFAFARGAHAGQCLHEILEHADLALPEPQTRTLVTTTLRRHGLHEPAAHAGMIAPVDTVLAMLRDLAGARSTLADAALVEVCAGARMAEWQFCLAAGDAPLRALAAVFERHAAPALAAYAARLAELPARTLHGFLSGFADLVTEYRGRYFLFDWKSNHLGDRADDYGPAALRDSMFAHDYVLQYHLYVLALHRHLRVRLSGYDYDRHFGGVCYPYLRGVRAGTATGLFTDRPPRALIVAMDRWLGGEAAR